MYITKFQQRYVLKIVLSRSVLLYWFVSLSKARPTTRFFRHRDRPITEHQDGDVRFNFPQSIG